VAQDELFRKQKCYLLVYSITNLDSFFAASDLHEKIVKAHGGERRHLAFVLVANKSDEAEAREALVELLPLC